MRAHQSTRDRYELLVAYVQKSGALPRPAVGEQGSGAVDDHRFLAHGETSPGGVAQTALLVARAVKESREERVAKSPPGAPKDDSDDDDEESANVPRRFLVAGRTPGRLIEELAETTRAPEHAMDWRSALAMFVARARSPVHTWSRPSRRFPQRIFEVPGRSWAPRRTENPRLLVAIDTSLSMTRFELEEIARQLVLLSTYSEVTIAECDVSVARVYPFNGKIENVVGRGGTDLRPVFAPSLLGAHDVDGVVYFTDGDGPFTKEPPPVPTLWVLTKPQAFRCPWGERARLREPR
jgi:predicted metal-dependent peptidase